MLYEIVIRGCWAEVTPALPDAVSAALRTQVRAFSHVDGEIKEHSAPLTLFKSGPNSTTITAGHVDRIAGQLESLGHAVSIDYLTDWPLLQNADLHVLDDPELPLVAQQIVHALSSNPRGQIVVGSDGTAAAAIALACSIFPNERIFVVTANKSAARSLFRRARKLTDRPIDIDSEKIWGVANRVFIASGLTFSFAMADDFDVIVFADARAATALRTWKNALYLGNKLFFCLRRTTEQLDPWEELCLEAICGPEIYRQTARVEKKLDARVLMTSTPIVPISTTGMDALERKLSAIWRNDARNDLIASIAEGFTGGNIQLLWQHGLLLQEDEDWFGREETITSTVILVESPEHGHELIQRLPGWRLRWIRPDSLPVNENGELELELAAVDREVVTMAYAERYAISAEVLIVAMGTDKPWSRQWQPSGAGGEGKELLLVDLADDFDERAREDTEHRLEYYRQRQWSIEGAHRKQHH